MSQIALEVETTDSATQPPQTASSESTPTPQANLENGTNTIFGLFVDISISICSDSILDAILYALAVLFILVMLPFALLFAAAQWLLCNKTFLDDDNHWPSTRTFSQNVNYVHEKAKKFVKLPAVIRLRLVIISVAWIIVNLTVPGLKNKLVLGTKLWKWSLLVVMITCGYHVINMANQFLLYVLCEKTKLRKKRNVVYYAKGMRQSVNLVVWWGSILLTWLFYFNTSHGIKKTEDTNVVLHLGTWSFVTLAMGAVLWAIKSVLLLKWEADAVYRRFAGRIFSARSQIYFLGRICGWPVETFKPDDVNVTHTHDTNEDHNPVSQASAENASKRLLATTERSTDNTDQHDENNDFDNKKAKGILCIDDEVPVDDTSHPPQERKEKNATLYEIKKMSLYFVNLSRASSREDDGTRDVSNHCRKINPETNDQAPNQNYNFGVSELIGTFKMDEKDAQILHSNVKDERSSSRKSRRPLPSQISYEEFEKYMVKAHTKCLTLGHTLLDAREVVRALNKVMTGILIAIIIIVWLLLTDITSTKIVVVIASPFITATFVFGETCKKIFEGVIFSFINHPFDVGDLCIINGTELEVKCMSVLSTKFLVIGTKEEAREEAVYPNSALASMPIINLKGEPDPSDFVELPLDSKYSKAMLDALSKKIHKHFEEDDGNKYERAHTIIIKEIGNSNVKMEIQYKHVMGIHETTHSECLRKKRRLKSELLLLLKQSTEEIEGKNGSSASPVSEQNYNRNPFS